jgi:hypothetical protein
VGTTQVHGGNVWRVVMQEGPPSLAGRLPPFDHVLGDARLRDLKPEIEQFDVDAWRAPKLVRRAHLTDQHAHPVCTENLIRVDDVMESPKLEE